MLQFGIGKFIFRSTSRVSARRCRRLRSVVPPAYALSIRKILASASSFVTSTVSQHFRCLTQDAMTMVGCGENILWRVMNCLASCEKILLRTPGIWSRIWQQTESGAIMASCCRNLNNRSGLRVQKECSSHLPLTRLQLSISTSLLELGY